MDPDVDEPIAPPKLDPVYIEIAGVVLRWLLTTASAGLVSRHILSADQSERVVTALAHDLLLWLPAAGVLLYSVWRRYVNRRRRLDPAFDRRKSPAPSAGSTA